MNRQRVFALLFILVVGVLGFMEASWAQTPGTIVTVAGGGVGLGDGGSATAATLNFPKSVFVDGAGNLYIADTYNSRIRKVIDQLATFTATEDHGVLTIAWTTGQAQNQAGFNVYRSLRLQDGFEKLNNILITGQTTFQYLDRTVLLANQIYYYRLELVRASGETGLFGPVSVRISAPQKFTLHQNYPNPFNPETTIHFNLPSPSQVTLRIYNLLGQEVATLINGEDKSAGYHMIRWNGRDRNGRRVASGVYFYQLTTGRFVASRKMTLLR